jgi:hypothetical protein
MIATARVRRAMADIIDVVEGGEIQPFTAFIKHEPDWRKHWPWSN